MSPPPTLAAADAFTRNKVRWLLAVARTPGLPISAHRLATVIALHYLNRQKGIAWPGIAVLENDLGLDKSTIQRGIAALEKGGLLHVKRSRGRGHASELRPMIPAEKGSSAATFSADGKGSADATFSTGKGGNPASEKVAGLLPHTFEEPFEGARARSRAAAAPQPSEGFDTTVPLGERGQGRAPERAPPPDPAAGPQVLDDEDLRLVEAEDQDHLDPARGFPVSAEDLDHLERAAQRDPGTGDDPGDDPRRAAARALAGLHPDRLLDHGLIVDDLIDGAINGDAQLLEDRLELLGTLAARGPAGRLERALEAQRAILSALFAATAPDRASALTERCMARIDAAAAAARAEDEAEDVHRRGAAHG